MLSGKVLPLTRNLIHQRLPTSIIALGFLLFRHNGEAHSRPERLREKTPAQFRSSPNDAETTTQ